MLFDRICRENGISHRHSAIKSPTTTGKIERFHQSIRKEFLLDRTFSSLELAQKALDAWVAEYNNERPHQALDMATPAERFLPTRSNNFGQLVTVDSYEDQKGQWILRRIGSNGCMSVDNHVYSVGNAYKEQLADVFVDGTLIQVWSKNHLIKTFARPRTGPVRKIRSDGLNVKAKVTTEGKASGED